MLPSRKRIGLHGSYPFSHNFQIFNVLLFISFFVFCFKINEEKERCVYHPIIIQLEMLVKLLFYYLWAKPKCVESKTYVNDVILLLFFYLKVMIWLVLSPRRVVCIFPFYSICWFRL